MSIEGALANLESIVVPKLAVLRIFWPSMAVAASVAALLVGFGSLVGVALSSLPSQQARVPPLTMTGDVARTIASPASGNITGPYPAPGPYVYGSTLVWDGQVYEMPRKR